MQSVSFDKTTFSGLFSVRNAIIDYCSEEQASAIIGKLFQRCQELENKFKISCITDFELRHVCLPNNEECVDVHYLDNVKKLSVGFYRLYYRNHQLTHQSLAEEIEHEIIPFSMTGVKIMNVCPNRMRILLRNSHNALKAKSKDIAISIFNVIEHHLGGDKTRFNIEVCKKNIKVTIQFSKDEKLEMSIPVCWFEQPKTKSVTTGLDEEYIVEPQS